MSFESLTDDKIADLINCQKRLTNPQARVVIKDGHEQINFNVIATDDSGYKFEVYKRKNTRDGMDDDFSCGLLWISPNGEVLTLRRYNGSSHNHRNQLEKNQLGSTHHIHFASEKYIKANKKAEGFAEPSTRYKTLDGALHCLLSDCNISGLKTVSDDTSQTFLFEIQ
ncbi:MAG: hypothetical protein LCH54_17465 [Bacteroidetes bacterium]|nr:hypothetical protein [Bacteroidota bacterium]